MEEKWYISGSLNLGLTLANPTQIPFKVNENFKTFTTPPVWKNENLQNQDILIDGKYIYYSTNNTFLFISKNLNSLNQLVRLWNKYTSENNTFEGLIV